MLIGEICAHPCGYKYALVEEKRPGEYFPVFEDEQGTFIMNSKDLCMIEHIPDLIKAGIKALRLRVGLRIFLLCSHSN